MKSIAVAFLVLSMSPAMALANICNTISSSHLERDQCRKNFEERGLIESGDWMIGGYEDEKQKSRKFARNYSTSPSYHSRAQGLNSFMELECATESVASLYIWADKPINKDYNPLVSFDNQKPYVLSAFLAFSYPDKGRGVYLVSDQKFIKKLLGSSFLSVRILTGENDVATYSYTLDTDDRIYESLSCLR